jgi:hypothetical protein
VAFFIFIEKKLSDIFFSFCHKTVQVLLAINPPVFNTIVADTATILPLQNGLF